MIYECHGHIILDSESYSCAVARHEKGVDKTFVSRNLKTCADNGIVFYRDGGDKHGASVFAKRIAAEYGIDYRTPAYIVHKKGYYGGMFGKAFESISEFRELVAEAKRLGADFIKMTASGMLDLSDGGSVTGPAMSIEDLREMVNIAHGEGFAVMTHANGADSIMRAVESGADSIEHGFYMDSKALRAMAQTGAVWVPTTVAVANLIGAGRYDDEKLIHIVDAHKTSLKQAAAIGVLVACGSDAGASYVPQGAGTIEELKLLNLLGIDTSSGNRKIEEVFRRRC